KNMCRRIWSHRRKNQLITYTTLVRSARAIPHKAPAAGSGQGMIVLTSMPDLRKGGRKINVLQTLIGGSGGRPFGDGYDGTDYSFGFLRNTPIEAIEAEMDLVVHEYAYVRDSAGPGRFRGGLGVRMAVEALVPDTIFTVRGMERTRFAPWGVHGGQWGGLTSPAIVNRGRPDERRVPNVDILVVKRGDVLELSSPGGGRYGDPCDRDPQGVAGDVALGGV